MRIAAIATLIVVAPLLQGVLRTMRARLSGRPGPSVFQPYRELRKLCCKEAFVPVESSLLVLVAPGLVLGASITLAMLLPLRDVVAFVMTLAMGRFVLTLATLDTRSGFGGMAASREMFFAALAEAPLMLALACAVYVPGTLAHISAAAAIVLVMLAETARIPVDNQETHYELTMVHEGMTLEYSGWHLALLQAASMVRQAVFFVVVAMALPGSGVAVVGWLLLLVILIPIVERRYAKLRLFEVPQLFATATLLAVVAAGLHFITGASW